MIYSGNINNIFAILSHHPCYAIIDLLQKSVLDKYGLGLKKYKDFVVNYYTVDRFSDM